MWLNTKINEKNFQIPNHVNYQLLLLLSSFSCVRLFATPWTVQPSRLLRPWDFPGKSTGVGFHCLLQNYQLGNIYRIPRKGFSKLHHSTIQGFIFWAKLNFTYEKKKNSYMKNLDFTYRLKLTSFSETPLFIFSLSLFT